MDKSTLINHTDIPLSRGNCLHNIFPTPVWEIKATKEIEPVIEDIIQNTYKYKENNKSEKYSNIGGYQTETLPIDRFHPNGLDYIESIIKEYISPEYEISKERLPFAGWWVNINGTGSWNAPHCHPGSDLVLIWYLTDSNGLLSLINPYTYSRVHLLSCFSDTNEPSSVLRVDAKKGDIIIFPSDMQHMVMPNKNKEDRLSVSMNLNLVQKS